MRNAAAYNTHELRMKFNMRHFALQKAMNCTLKSRLLQAKRRHIENALITNVLQTRQRLCANSPERGIKTGVAGITANHAPT